MLQYTSSAHLSAARSMRAIGGSSDDLGVCVGNTPAADLVVGQFKALHTPRVQIVVAVVALDDVG